MDEQSGNTGFLWMNARAADRFDPSGTVGHIALVCRSRGSVHEEELAVQGSPYLAVILATFIKAPEKQHAPIRGEGFDSRTGLLRLDQAVQGHAQVVLARVRVVAVEGLKRVVEAVGQYDLVARYPPVQAAYPPGFFVVLSDSGGAVKQHRAARME